jgi:hypothetical protein
MRCALVQAEEKRLGSLIQEVIEKPVRENTMAMSHGTYDKLDEDGLAPPGSRVSGGDVIIGASLSIVWSWWVRLTVWVVLKRFKKRFCMVCLSCLPV